jgi:tetratricopeptide (TPR) repeat protein
MKRFTPGTAEYETYKRWNERSKEYRIHENKAMEFENKGEYELAIGEYRKTLKSEYNKWITHRHLLDLYEKAGHNDLAIQEIDWLLSQKPSRQVIDELNARKKRLQSLPKSTAAE